MLLLSFLRIALAQPEELSLWDYIEPLPANNKSQSQQEDSPQSNTVTFGAATQDQYTEEAFEEGLILEIEDQEVPDQE